MDKLQLTISATIAVAGLVSSSVTLAQALPPAKRAERVQLTQAPAVESARDHLTIIQWTVNNPGGFDDHYGVVRYGRDPNNLDQTAVNHIRLNRADAQKLWVQLPRAANHNQKPALLDTHRPQ